MISQFIYILFRIIYLIILIVVLCSWIPIINLRKEPMASLVRIYNVIIAPFKAIIPPIGMIDISPLVAFIVFQFAERQIHKILVPLGL